MRYPPISLIPEEKREEYRKTLEEERKRDDLHSKIAIISMVITWAGIAILVMLWTASQIGDI